MQKRKWSGRRGSNPRPTAWEAVTLPLSYSRSARRDYHSCVWIGNLILMTLFMILGKAILNKLGPEFRCSGLRDILLLQFAELEIHDPIFMNRC